jgi:hypothetical protein
VVRVEAVVLVVLELVVVVLVVLARQTHLEQGLT